MNAKVEQAGGNSAAEIAKITAAAVVLAAGVFAYYAYNDLPTWQRLLLLLAGFVGAGAIGYFTRAGRGLVDFLVESRFELRKVVWPSRQETIQTTLVIMAVVVLLSLILGLIDWVLKFIVLDLLLKA